VAGTILGAHSAANGFPSGTWRPQGMGRSTPSTGSRVLWHRC